MTPQTWSELFNLILLALGAAMAVGTGLALLRYRRDGVFPGQPIDDDGRPVAPPAVRAAWIKVGIGTVLLVWGLVGLSA